MKWQIVFSFLLVMEKRTTMIKWVREYGLSKIDNESTLHSFKSVVELNELQWINDLMRTLGAQREGKHPD